VKSKMLIDVPHRNRAIGDDLMEDFEMSEKQVAKALASMPYWNFTSAASVEIMEFFDSVPNEERQVIIANVKCPRFCAITVNVEDRGKMFPFNYLIGDARNEKDPRRFRAYLQKDPTGDLLGDALKEIGEIALFCFLGRCLFKSRYIEKLTKHQERSLRRYGAVPSSETRFITIAWDAPTPKYTYEKRKAREEAKRKVCLHEVAGHPRRLRSGKTVWVRCHHRGDANVPRKTVHIFKGSESIGERQ
jgi:hypothetical protein